MACRSTRRFSTFPRRTRLEVRLEQAEAARGLGARVGPPVAPGRAVFTCGVERQVDFHVAGRLALVRQRQLAGPLGLEDAAPAGRRRLRPAALDRGAHAALAVPGHRKPQRDGALGLIGHAAAVRGALSGGRAGAGVGAGRFLGRKSGASGFFFAVVGGGCGVGLVDRGGGAGASRALAAAARRRPGRCRLRLTRGLAPAGGFARGLAAAGAGAGADAGATAFGRSALQMAQQRNCASASLCT